MKLLSRAISSVFTSASVSVPLILTSNLVLKAPEVPILDASGQEFNLSFEKPTVPEKTITPSKAKVISEGGSGTGSIPSASMPSTSDDGTDGESLPKATSDTQESQQDTSVQLPSSGSGQKSSLSEESEEKKDAKTESSPAPKPEEKVPVKPNQVGVRKINPTFLEAGRAVVSGFKWLLGSK